VKDKLSDPYKTIGNVTILCIVNIR